MHLWYRSICLFKIPICYHIHKSDKLLWSGVLTGLFKNSHRIIMSFSSFIYSPFGNPSDVVLLPHIRFAWYKGDETCSSEAIFNLKQRPTYISTEYMCINNSELYCNSCDIRTSWGYLWNNNSKPHANTSWRRWVFREITRWYQTWVQDVSPDYYNHRLVD